MFSFLQNHPFAVEAFFESSVVLTFAVLKEEMASLIPECLQLDTHENKWAFIAVAMVQTQHLRPRGFPKLFGNDFFLIGYRIFVRYSSATGKRLRGLYILKSETDKKKMEFLGNIFTKYRYTTTDISETVEKNAIQIRSVQSGVNVEVELPEGEVHLPFNSPFKNWKEAGRFSGPLPFTFSFDPSTNNVLIVEGVRQNWKPQPIKIIGYHISFLTSFKFTQILPANAFIIQNIPYYWKKGKIEKWQG